MLSSVISAVFRFFGASSSGRSEQVDLKVSSPTPRLPPGSGFTCQERLVGGFAAPVSLMGCQRNLVVGVRVEAPQVVLALAGWQFHHVAVCRVGPGFVGNPDLLHICHRRQPGEQRCGVRHVSDVHLVWGVDH